MNLWPARCRENEYGDPSIRETLLVSQILIRGHEQVERGSLGKGEQLTVAHRGPTAFVNGFDVWPIKASLNGTGVP